MRFLLVWHIDSHILWTNLNVAKMLIMLLINFYPIKATVPHGENYFFYLSLSVKLQYFLNLPKYFKERPTTLRECNAGRFYVLIFRSRLSLSGALRVLLGNQDIFVTWSCFTSYSSLLQFQLFQWGRKYFHWCCHQCF